MNQLKPPKHLKAATKQWWASVAEDYDLEAHHLRLLTLACESWDRCQGAREALAKHGTVYEDRFGQPRCRPEVSIERDSKLSFARLLRELALDIDEPTAAARPSPITGNAGLKISEG